MQSFVDQGAQNPSLYQSPPINHIVPAFNTITFAGQFEEVNLRLLAKPDEIFKLNESAAITIGAEDGHLAFTLARAKNNLIAPLEIRRKHA